VKILLLVMQAEKTEEIRDLEFSSKALEVLCPRQPPVTGWLEFLSPAVARHDDRMQGDVSSSTVRQTVDYPP
jgi:hypothetical protein